MGLVVLFSGISDLFGSVSSKRVIVEHNTKWKTLAKYKLTLRMHFPNVFLPQGRLQESALVFAHPL